VGGVAATGPTHQKSVMSGALSGRAQRTMPACRFVGFAVWVDLDCRQLHAQPLALRQISLFCTAWQLLWFCVQQSEGARDRRGLCQLNAPLCADAPHCVLRSVKSFFGLSEA
jgi:hypothetical protein